MTHLAHQLRDAIVHQTLGTVRTVSEKDGALTVDTRAATHRAQRAVSCLVAPRVGDQVMLAVDEDGNAWILAVLERETDGVTLAVDGDLDVQPSGRLRLSAARGVELVGQAVSLMANRLDVKALQTEVVLDRLGMVGRTVQTEIERVKTVAGSLDMVMDRFTQKVARSYRTVTEMDQLRAERIDHTAEQTMNLRGKDTLMTAERLVKVDGEQIHMG